MSLMGELRSNAIGPWDLLDVSEEHEAAGRWTTVQATGAREAEGKGENMTGQGLGKGGVAAALLHRASVWNVRKVGRPRDYYLPAHPSFLPAVAMVSSGRSVAIGQLVVYEKGSGVVDTAEVESSACVSAEV
ncbi:hypothetical protein Daus18300_010575 [Diaporthe australafricana]|uniref:Uncharacterized protein n=1 Tax=Diaporthe australafricana TaxID=127596 RepID=A0ABR3WA02_9PEZI